MEFVANLQSLQSHDALLRHQDLEVRLLETVRRFQQQWVKITRDYVSALELAVSQAQRMDLGELKTPLMMAWQTILKEKSQIAALWRKQTGEVDDRTVERLDLVVKDKRGIRRSLADERYQIDQEWSQVEQQVSKCHTDYVKHLEKTRADKTKYEDLISKGRAGGKFEDIKTKYTKSSTKLHKSHNDYVLALNTAELTQRGAVDSSLPALLGYEEFVLADQLQQCKSLLQTFLHQTDLCTGDVQDLQKNMVDAVESLEPETEYRDFVTAHKSEPLQPKPFAFEDSLLDSYSGVLSAGKISLDSLSVDSLKLTRETYTAKVDQLAEKVKTTEAEQRQQEASIAAIGDSTDELQMKQLQVQQRQLQISRKNLAVNKGRLDMYRQLFDTVEKEFTEMGSDPLPQPLGDDTVQLPGGVQSPGQAIKEKVFNIFKKPNHPPHPPPKDIPSMDTSGDNSSLSGEREGEASRRHNYEPTELPMHSPPLPGLKPAVKPKPRPKPKTANHILPLSGSGRIEDEVFFHGVLPREEVNRLLQNLGQFLVRESVNKKTAEKQFVLSVMWEGHKHFIVQGEPGAWKFEGEQFATIQELLMYQVESGTPVTKKSGVVLKVHVPREEWALENDQVEVGEKIGSGNFGTVHKGRYLATNQVVAIKMCKENLPEDLKKKFIQEGRILKAYRHPNIVQFVGIAAQKMPVMILLEYIGGGALLTYLRKRKEKRDIALTLMLTMCLDASRGMEYLEERNCIHRDLAARNCLVTEGECRIKISDFGMSREEEVYEASNFSNIPMKWTAPEALNKGKYSSLSDVWSFGVLMWEVFSFGKTPYTGMSNPQAKENVDRGHRLEKPPSCIQDVYDVMMHCWKALPEDRPKFGALCSRLEGLIAKHQ